jgi:hypothetical protein
LKCQTYRLLFGKNNQIKKLSTNLLLKLTLTYEFNYYSFFTHHFGIVNKTIVFGQDNQNFTIILDAGHGKIPVTHTMVLQRKTLRLKQP